MKPMKQVIFTAATLLTLGVSGQAMAWCDPATRPICETGLAPVCFDQSDEVEGFWDCPTFDPNHQDGTPYLACSSGMPGAPIIIFNPGVHEIGDTDMGCSSGSKGTGTTGGTGSGGTGTGGTGTGGTGTGGTGTGGGGVVTGGKGTGGVGIIPSAPTTISMPTMVRSSFLH